MTIKKKAPAEVYAIRLCKALIVETMIEGPRAMNKHHLAHLIQGTVGLGTLDDFNPWDWATKAITRADLKEAREQIS